VRALRAQYDLPARGIEGKAVPAWQAGGFGPLPWSRRPFPEPGLAGRIPLTRPGRPRSPEPA